MNGEEFMLQLKNITRRYNDKVAVSGVDLEIEPGTFVGIIGRSGAGKSTLLRMINRLVEPSEGTIHWDGRDVTGLKGSALRDWRAQCAMIFQHFNLVDRLDVLTNVLMGRLNYVSTPKSLLRIWSDEERLIALSALQQFDIAHLAAHRADELFRAASSSAWRLPVRLCSSAHHSRRRADCIA
jgi:phosphonate transport system ATP-binding protein